jgi:hypothetical protein
MFARHADAREHKDLLDGRTVEEPKDPLFLPFKSLQFSSELISKDLYKSVFKVAKWDTTGCHCAPCTVSHQHTGRRTGWPVSLCVVSYSETIARGCIHVAMQGSLDGAPVAIVKPCAAGVACAAPLLKELGQHPNIMQSKG